MGTQFQPVIGDWYESGAGDMFEVVAIDRDEGSVEIQYFDGAIEELDLETWLDLELAPVEPPEDYSGSLDLAREDFLADYDDSPRRFGLAGNNPLDALDFER